LAIRFKSWSLHVVCTPYAASTTASTCVIGLFPSYLYLQDVTTNEQEQKKVHCR
jgi:hypothetical protein